MPLALVFVVPSLVMPGPQVWIHQSCMLAFGRWINRREHNQLAFLSCGLVLFQHVSVALGDPFVAGMLSASGWF
ncbi:hypothetical protein Nepgr_016482 [Nepenthes gracilis]|uniref:Uncharacterized protein n=1 Tax=Nepenthes gracilis TaxID=150966 RepID=A0AAD3XSD2_NEPGR|nr:hypothetical protein Nepgr_016482 [Nepenthes gracilis]